MAVISKTVLFWYIYIACNSSPINKLLLNSGQVVLAPENLLEIIPTYLPRISGPLNLILRIIQNEQFKYLTVDNYSWSSSDLESMGDHHLTL